MNGRQTWTKKHQSCSRHATWLLLGVETCFLKNWLRLWRSILDKNYLKSFFLSQSLGISNVYYKLFVKGQINVALVEKYIFVAFCSFFPCSLTVCERGRKQKKWGRQQKSEVDNRKRGGRQQKSSRADKWNDFLIIWPVWVRLLFWVSFRFGPTSGLGPLPVGTYFRLVSTSGWGSLPAEGRDFSQLDKEANPRTATGS